MPENRKAAERRAKELGFPKSNVICLEGDNKCYIAPMGIKSYKAKKAYAELRAQGKSQEDAAKIAHSIDE